jgi:hypothetical protein
MQMCKCKLLVQENNPTTNMKNLNKTKTQNDNTWAKMLHQSKRAKRIKRLCEFLHEHLRFKVICEACNKEDSVEDAYN